ncbi:MAG: hypothetical protein AAFX85_05985 [Pseudomonadota bacterium]
MDISHRYDEAGTTVFVPDSASKQWALPGNDGDIIRAPKPEH